ncbi:MAG: hypothetical protein IJI98_09595 [Methanosphaera sp.]|nr:hypothetical protein [Methanosphaera sp.]
MNPSTPKIIKTNFNKLIKIGFVEVRAIGIESEEYVFYDRIKNSHLKNNKPIIGDGEAAVITLSHMNNGGVASNNLSDVYDYVKEYNLNLITTAFILAMAYNEKIKTKKELNDIWIKMQKNGRKKSLPKSKSFTEYYSKIYPRDSKFMGIP